MHVEVSEAEMNQFIYILFGWVLGLISPTIVDIIKSGLRRREIAAAIRVELEDLQYRLAMSSFVLLQSYGELTREFVIWIQAIVEKYAGHEPKDSIGKMISQLARVDEETFGQIASQFRAKTGTGSSLKIFQAKFLESHLAEISKLPISIQSKIHEFRNQLDLLN